MKLHQLKVELTDNSQIASKTSSNRFGVINFLVKEENFSTGR